MECRIVERLFNAQVYAQLDASWPDVLKRVLARRDITCPSQLDHSVNQLLSPEGLMGMQAACSRLAQAIEQQQHILIVGDYDTDGATSTAVAYRGLRLLGARQVSFHIPNRFEAGYGLCAELVTQLAEQKPDVILTVDNGIASHEGAQRAHELGIDLVITDHHLSNGVLPQAAAIVNPNQPGDGFESKYLAGVGVIFYVLLGLRRHLREQGHFEHQTEPNLSVLLDLVALGTVADVMPLDQNNRILVSQGVARIRSGQACAGILALIGAARREPGQVCSQDLSFAIAPRLNSAGRLDDMTLGVRCLITDDAQEAQALVDRLSLLNDERKQIESDMRAEAMALLEKLCFERGECMPQAVVLYSAEWHQGVIGILAGRIKEQLSRPAIVFAKVENDILRGSARSVPGINLRDVMERIDAQRPGILLSYGGHAMAAGVSLQLKDLEVFKDLLNQEMARVCHADTLASEIESDGQLHESEMSLETTRLLRDFLPWGQRFPAPAFDDEFIITRMRLIRDCHIALHVRKYNSMHELEMIAFNTPWKEWMQEGQAIRAVFELSENNYRGVSRVQLMVRHLQAVD
jgi:single-stranded-DNA-specific exonuclease